MRVILLCLLLSGCASIGDIAPDPYRPENVGSFWNHMYYDWILNDE